jgi:hypothetical protein
MIQAPEQTRRVQEVYFKFLFKQNAGIVCIARINRVTKAFHEQFFVYDFLNLTEIVDYCQRWCQEQDLYVAPFFFTKCKRTKETIEACPAAYADLDACPPDKLLVKPSVIVETSESRYQALWVFDELQEPGVAEDISRRIAYYHADDGADKSGWDLTQLLRIPGTTNFKHRNDFGYDQVFIRVADTRPQSVEQLLEVYPQAKGFEFSDIPLPEESQLQETPEDILQRYRNRLMPTAFRLFSEEPDDDWSKNLWQLENLCYEGGLSREEAYVVCLNAACNKYKRDKRPTTLLWKEVCKAYARRDSEYSLLRHPTVDSLPVITDDELSAANSTHTIVDEYIDWAKSIGDAAWQYHQASAFILLSGLLAGNIKLPTSFGTMIPNLWFMILADTTLTRKTTAMDLGIDLLTEIDPDAILATDGSIEGLYTALALRPGRPSVFLRDEFSGFLDSMVKKDYMAGTAESLTKLYDGKMQKRVLRKETVEVKSPVLILYTGGIKTRVLQLLNYEHVASGFLPRFIFITAESDISKLQPLGPPTERSIGERDRIRARFATIAGHYATRKSGTLVIHGTPVQDTRAWEAQLTPEAWSRYNKFESDLLAIGLKSNSKELLTPTFDRLAKSGLKVATLIAAARRLEDKIIVTEEDLIKAFSYVEYWRTFTVEILDNIGKSTGEHQLSRILALIQRKPGISRGEVMQHFHLSAVDTSRIFETMEQRNLIIRQKSGRGERLWIVN